MKKSIQLLAIAFALVLITIQCGNEESGTKVSKISGTVNLTDAAVAGGAIVSLSSSPNSAEVTAVTVSDATGKYSFMGVEDGTYYLSAKYDPANTNSLEKSASAVILTSAEVEVAVSSDVTQDIAMVGMASTGDGTISLTGSSSYDNTHSSIAFEFPYDAFNAVFKGHFATAGVDVIEFDEADPTNTEIKAWVDLTSVETGSPSGTCGHGRDGITGCIQGTFKVDIDATDTVSVYCENGDTNTAYPNTDKAAYDLWGDGSTTTYMKQSSIVGSTGVATLEVSSVTAYGTGYHANATFNFAGQEQTVDFFFNYVEGFEGTNRSNVATNYNSIFGWFKFNPAAIGVTSSHLGDVDVTVILSVQFNNPIAE